MRYFDSFSGVGGFSLGIEYAFDSGQTVQQQADTGVHQILTDPDESGEEERVEKPVCVGFSECDKFASDVLRYRFPNVPNHGDITKIDWEEVGDFDLLTGGVPCQSWSIAGKRKGFEDPRGNMWYEFARCLREKKPKCFLAENVKGILSHDGGKSFETICELLCSCGYAIDFDVLNAKDFQVPQNRNRVIIIGKRVGSFGVGEIV